MLDFKKNKTIYYEKIKNNIFNNFSTIYNIM